MNQFEIFYEGTESLICFLNIALLCTAPFILSPALLQMVYVILLSKIKKPNAREEESRFIITPTTQILFAILGPCLWFLHRRFRSREMKLGVLRQEASHVATKKLPQLEHKLMERYNGCVEEKLGEIKQRRVHFAADVQGTAE